MTCGRLPFGLPFNILVSLSFSYIMWLANLLPVNIHDEGDSRYASCAPSPTIIRTETRHRLKGQS